MREHVLISRTHEIQFERLDNFGTDLGGGRHRGVETFTATGRVAVAAQGLFREKTAD